MGAYSFLDSIDYSPEVLLKYTTMIPVRYLLEGILAYPEGGLEEIGETPIQKWQEIDCVQAWSAPCVPEINRNRSTRKFCINIIL